MWVVVERWHLPGGSAPLRPSRFDIQSRRTPREHDSTRTQSPCSCRRLRHCLRSLWQRRRQRIQRLDPRRHRGPDRGHRSPDEGTEARRTDRRRRGSSWGGCVPHHLRTRPTPPCGATAPRSRLPTSIAPSRRTSAPPKLAVDDGLRPTSSRCRRATAPPRSSSRCPTVYAPWKEAVRQRSAQGRRSWPTATTSPTTSRAASATRVANGSSTVGLPSRSRASRTRGTPASTFRRPRRSSSCPAEDGTTLAEVRRRRLHLPAGLHRHRRGARATRTLRSTPHSAVRTRRSTSSRIRPSPARSPTPTTARRSPSRSTWTDSTSRSTPRSPRARHCSPAARDSGHLL